MGRQISAYALDANSITENKAIEPVKNRVFIEPPNIRASMQRLRLAHWSVMVKSGYQYTPFERASELKQNASNNYLSGGPPVSRISASRCAHGRTAAYLLISVQTRAGLLYRVRGFSCAILPGICLSSDGLDRKSVMSLFLSGLPLWLATIIVIVLPTLVAMAGSR